MNSANPRKASLYSYRFSNVELDESRLELRVGGVLVEVEQKPVRVLIELMRRANEPVSRDELQDTVWEGRPTVPNVLTNAINKLREALGKPAGDCLTTVRGVGYQLTAQVERMVLGRRLSSRLQLKPGDAVPGRDSYVLEQLLGASPGSEVWLGRHRKTREPRAYKFSLDGSSLEALKREVTIYRLLRESLGERQDIVRIMDWNFNAEPYYLECEYCGSNLAEWAKADEQLSQLSHEERLALFIRIAETVAAAHGVGVLHRDLKPANVLMAAEKGGGWQVRVSDFGSGRLLDPSLLEQYGISLHGMSATQALDSDSHSGTPLYLAPELIAGQTHTVRSDVYALGLMLYQLLVADLKRPLAPGWERSINDPLLQADIAKASDHDPAHRFRTAAELVDHLQRLTERREERAQQEHAAAETKRLQKQLERSKARRPLLYAVIASLSLGILASGALAYFERQARLQASIERKRAEAISAFLNDDLLAAADSGGPQGQQDPPVSLLLARATTRLKTQFSDDPLTKAAVNSALGKAYFGLSRYPDAQVAQTEAVTLLRQARPGSPAALAEAEYVLARTLDQQGRREEGAAMLVQADRDAGAELRQPSLLALISHVSHGDAGLLRMQPATAAPQYEAAEQLRKQIVPDDLRWLFRIRNDLAWCYVRMGRSEDALEALKPLMSEPNALMTVGARDFSKARTQYAMALLGAQRYAEAEAVLKAALDQVRSSLGDEHYITALTWNYLAYSYLLWDHLPEALAAQQKAYDIYRRRTDDMPSAAVITKSEWASYLYLSGRLNDALPLLREAYAQGIAEVGNAAPATQLARFYLASALNDIGDSMTAAAMMEQLEPDALESVEPGLYWNLRIMGLRGLILKRSGKDDEAQPLLLDATRQLTKEHAPSWTSARLQQASRRP